MAAVAVRGLILFVVLKLLCVGNSKAAVHVAVYLQCWYIVKL